jgi:hypothetical protein
MALALRSSNNVIHDELTSHNGTLAEETQDMYIRIGSRMLNKDPPPFKELAIYGMYTFDVIIQNTRNISLLSSLYFLSVLRQLQWNWLTP